MLDLSGTGLEVGWVMGSGGWGLSGLKQDGLCFVIWAVVLPDVLNQTVFTWGWGLNGLACRAGRRPGWPGCAVLFGLGQPFSFSYGACGLVDCHLVLGGLVVIFENGLLLFSRQDRRSASLWGGKDWSRVNSFLILLLFLYCFCRLH